MWFQRVVGVDAQSVMGVDVQRFMGVDAQRVMGVDAQRVMGVDAQRVWTRRACVMGVDAQSIIALTHRAIPCVMAEYSHNATACHGCGHTRALSAWTQKNVAA